MVIQQSLMKSEMKRCWSSDKIIINLKHYIYVTAVKIGIQDVEHLKCG